MKITKISREELARELSDVARSWADGAEILRYIEAEGWLRDPAEPVPGQTITEQQLIQLWQVTVEGRSIDDFAQELKDNGITVVPDPEPEPTNVERLVEMIRENGYDIRHNGSRSGSVALALDLDAAGVKAPGGDDG